MSQQPVVIHNSNVQNNAGCLGGCGTVFAVLLLVGLAVEYWYVSVGVAVVAVGVGVWYLRQRELAALHSEAQPAVLGRSPATSPSAAATDAVTCAGCGAASGATAFCAHCGTARTKTCAGCGMTGLLSEFCPDCGSATYAPPSPM